MHYNGLSGANGEVLEIVDEANELGVYTAKVKIDGKVYPKPKTFFPDSWTPEQVLDAIDEAYHKGTFYADSNQIEYTMKSGIMLEINLNKNGKVVSAYPVHK